jgi:hypothetical protein
MRQHHYDHDDDRYNHQHHLDHYPNREYDRQHLHHHQCHHHDCHARQTLIRQAAVVAEATTFSNDVISSASATAAWEASMQERQRLWDIEVLANTAKQRYLSTATNVNDNVGAIMMRKHDLDRSDALVRVRDSLALVSKRSR